MAKHRSGRAALTKAAAAASLGLVAVLVPAPPPASAAVLFSVSGGTVTVTYTGTTPAPISVLCGPNGFQTESATPSPNVPCSAVTSVVINGTSTNQFVDATQLGLASFTQHPTLTANLGSGDDTLFAPLSADTIDMGPGDDTLYANLADTPDASVTMGTGTGDKVILRGTPQPDTITATTSGAALSVHLTNAVPTDGTEVITGAERLEIDGQQGGDAISAAGTDPASGLTSITLDGGPDWDTLVAGPVPCHLVSGSGNNTLTGTQGDDDLVSQGDIDEIHPGAGINQITDSDSLHAGGRLLFPAGGDDRYHVILPRRDVTYRLRPGAAAGTAVGTSSLDRSGQQALGATFTDVTADLVGNIELIPEADDRGLADVFALGGKTVHVKGDQYADDVADVTIPSGTWTTTGTPGSGTVTIDPDDPALGTVTIDSVGSLAVHGPWPTATAGYAHRVIRDLLLRLPGASEEQDLATKLTAKTTTPAKAVAAIMGTDEYRGLDVDRVFIAFLHRSSDAAGRSYWINALRNGRGLTRFRAQLFGSSEYYRKAGGTNGQYVLKAYEDVLGRSPDTSGYAYWTNKVDGGANRGAVALQFLSSTEARRAIVKDQYLRFLDRLPTTDEASGWVTKLAAVDGEQQLIASLAASAAYQSRT